MKRCDFLKLCIKLFGEKLLSIPAGHSPERLPSPSVSGLRSTLVLALPRLGGGTVPARPRDVRLQSRYQRGIIFGQILLIVLFLIGPVCAADTNLSQENLLFAQGNTAYQQGDYAKAAEAYEKIISDGWVSGPLYFNLANSYVKADHLGKAILNYERAKRLIPRDPDLKANDAYAQSLLKTPISMPTNFWQMVLTSHLSFYSLDEMAIIAFVLLAFLGAIILASLFWGWQNRGKVFLLGGVVILFVIYGGGLLLKVQMEKEQAVSLVETPARFEPRDAATTHYLLQEGGKVKILDQDGEWLKIFRSDGKSGWVKASTVEKI